MKWKRLALIVFDVVLGFYLVLAMTAFNRPDGQTDVCMDVPVTIEEGICEGFLTPDLVKAILQKGQLYPQGQPMKQVSTRQIEELLQEHELVEHAECYKSQSGHVCINIVQRIPVVRVMTAEGDDYCIDTHGEVMPRRGFTADMLVATGAISQAYAKSTLSRLAMLIVTDDFWRNQTEQLNILADGSVELVPRVGDHIAYLGQPVGVKRKLERLQKFYKYGLSQAGWNHYSRVNVEFDNQIICKRRHTGRRK